MLSPAFLALVLALLAVASISAPVPDASPDHGRRVWKTSFFSKKAGTVVGSITRAAAHPKYSDYGSSFKDYFSSGIDPKRFFFPHDFSNGEPFLNAWTKFNRYFSDGALNLLVKRETFVDQGSATGGGKSFNFTGGELRSIGFHGVGCYSVCMKPSPTSGVSSSFYVHGGQYDKPKGFLDPNPMHNEIDVEFVGKNTTMMQSNFFAQMKGQHSGSGNEKWHNLGFDAASGYHVYGFKWDPQFVEWRVDGKVVRIEKAENVQLPDPEYSPLRIAANVWPVSKYLQDVWAGKLDANFKVTAAHYKWIAFKKGSDCQVERHC